MAVKTSDKQNAVLGSRNYELDALKFFLSILVFFCHTNRFVGENTNLHGVNLGSLGDWSVMLFFVISGMMMVNSFMKKRGSYDNPGRMTYEFIKKKIFSLKTPYLISFFLCYTAYTVISITEGKWTFMDNIVRLVPDFFGFSAVAGFNTVNGAVWYIIAMIFCMIPLYYILCKNTEFYLYVLSPVLGLTTLGYMFKIGFNGAGSFDWIFLCTTGIVRALCGLSFGAIAYIIYDAIHKMKINRNGRVLLTVVEVILYVIVLGVIIFQKGKSTGYPIYVLAPIAFAISFSEISYLCGLFRFKWMRIFAPLSLAIYLTHLGVGRRITEIVKPDGSYSEKLLIMAVVSVIAVILYFTIEKAVKTVAPKVKAFFSE